MSASPAVVAAAQEALERHYVSPNPWRGDWSCVCGMAFTRIAADEHVAVEVASKVAAAALRESADDIAAGPHVPEHHSRGTIAARLRARADEQEATP